MLSGLISSAIYDDEVEKQAQIHHHPWGSSGILGRMSLGILNVGDSLKCDGAVCFVITLVIMSGLCVLVVILSMILVYRMVYPSE